MSMWTTWRLISDIQFLISYTFTRVRHHPCESQDDRQTLRAPQNECMCTFWYTWLLQKTRLTTLSTYCLRVAVYMYVTVINSCLTFMLRARDRLTSYANGREKFIRHMRYMPYITIKKGIMMLRQALLSWVQARVRLQENPIIIHMGGDGVPCVDFLVMVTS